jgi:hypothetical protein
LGGGSSGRSGLGGIALHLRNGENKK